MSRSRIEAPTERPRKDSLGGTEYTHPAYAQIGASRVSGSAVLYGSDFIHHQFIRVRIAKSSLTRSLSTDWLHANSSPYIEVDLSEAQWASFVSSMNIGSGVSCTLRYLGGEEISRLPDPIARTETFKAEATAYMRKALETLAALEASIAEMSLSGKKTDSLTKQVSAARAQISSNLGFVAEQFGGHMETVTEAAKVEVNAYAVNAIMRAGLSSLSGQPPIIELADATKEGDAK